MRHLSIFVAVARNDIVAYFAQMIVVVEGLLEVY